MIIIELSSLTKKPWLGPFHFVQIYQLGKLQAVHSHFLISFRYANENNSAKKIPKFG